MNNNIKLTLRVEEELKKLISENPKFKANKNMMRKYYLEKFAKNMFPDGGARNKGKGKAPNSNHPPRISAQEKGKGKAPNRNDGGGSEHNNINGVVYEYIKKLINDKRRNGIVGAAEEYGQDSSNNNKNKINNAYANFKIRNPTINISLRKFINKIIELH